VTAAMHRRVSLGGSHRAQNRRPLAGRTHLRRVLGTARAGLSWLLRAAVRACGGDIPPVTWHDMTVQHWLDGLRHDGYHRAALQIDSWLARRRLAPMQPAPEPVFLAAPPPEVTVPVLAAPEQWGPARWPHLAYPWTDDTGDFAQVIESLGGWDGHQAG
jgi:hypothetical protein